MKPANVFALDERFNLTKRNRWWLCFISALLSSSPVLVAQPQPVANPLIWLRADAGVGLAGTNVTGWTNQAASGTAFAMPTVAARPKFATNVVNGLPAIRFNDAHRLTNNLNRVLTNATIFTLCQFSAQYSDTDYVYTLGQKTVAGSQFSFARAFFDDAYHYDGGLARSSSNSIIPGFAFKVFTQVYGEGGPTNQLLYEDAFELLRSQSTNPYSVNLTNMVLGNYTSGANYFIGDIAEWLVYDRVLSTNERQQVEAYLRQRAALSTFTIVTNQIQFGLSSDFFVPADYDGDGKTDIAIWRPGAAGVAAFHIRRSSDGIIQTNILGQTGDDPSVVGDYDGDGKADPAVHRAGATAGTSNTWIYLSSSNGATTSVIWGQNGDFPGPGDYDGDGKFDFVEQRALFSFYGNFQMLFSGGGVQTNLHGNATDRIVPGDYDGDGKYDLSVVRAGSGVLNWNTLTRTGTNLAYIFGHSATDYTVQGDYNGDGKTDLGYWRNGSFEVHYSTGIPLPNPPFSEEKADRQFSLGQSGDYPVGNFNTH